MSGCGKLLANRAVLPCPGTERSMVHFFPHRDTACDAARESSKGRLLRMLLLAGVFALVLWGFWSNSQRRLEELGRQSVLRDATGEFTQAEKEALFAKARFFQSTYGLALKVQVHKEPSALREATPRDIFLDIAPARREVILTLPPLVRRAVGEGFITKVEDIFIPYFEAGIWKKALPAALDVLQTKLDEVSR